MPGSTEEGNEPDALAPALPDNSYEVEPDAGEETTKPRPKRRRGRKPAAGDTGAEAPTSEIEPDSSPMVERPVAEEPPITAAEVTEDAQPEAGGPKARRRPRARKASTATAAAAATPAPETEPEPEPSKPARKRKTKAAAAEPARQRSESAPATTSSVPAPDNDSAMTDAEGERRSGWWQRTFG